MCRADDPQLPPERIEVGTVALKERQRLADGEMCRWKQWDASATPNTMKNGMSPSKRSKSQEISLLGSGEISRFHKQNGDHMADDLWAREMGAMGAKAAIVLVRRVRLLCPKSFGELKIMFNLLFPGFPHWFVYLGATPVRILGRNRYLSETWFSDRALVGHGSWPCGFRACRPWGLTQNSWLRCVTSSLQRDANQDWDDPLWDVYGLKKKFTRTLGFIPNFIGFSCI